MLTTRQYTPPTCTLELIANQPLWTRWRKAQVWQNFRFKLSFDDPRLSEDQYVSIEGDRTHLQNLHQTLSGYIRDFLTASPLSAIPDASEAAAVDSESAPSHAQDNGGTFRPCSDFSIKPDGLLHHDLFLGELAPDPGESVVHLSVLQLFDLAIALNDCFADVEPLPADEPQPHTSPAWLRTALTIAVTVGLFSGIIHLGNYYRRDRTLTATQEPEAESPPLPPPQLVPPPPPIFEPTEPPPPPELDLKVAPDLPAVDTAPLAVPPPLFTESPPPPELMPGVMQGTDGAIVIPTEPVQPAPPPVASAPPPPPPVAAAPPTPPVNIGLAPGAIELPTLENAEPSVTVAVPPPETDIDDGDTPEASEEGELLAQMNKRPRAIASNRSQELTLFDEIPQVAEVRNYFRQNWYPPKNISKILQYSFLLNSDGSIQSITPIGQASVNWLEQIDFPPPETPFVSPTEEGETPKIRVVLEPSGRVQAFLEGGGE
ncbi:MAG: DUF4335 domain-containing protein [Limnospira sp.]